MILSYRKCADWTLTTMTSCDPLVNGFATTGDYILGPSNEQLTELDMNSNGVMAVQHNNIWAGGKLLGTYDPDGTHFYFDDPLGTRRAQTDSQGALEQTCQSLPFGNSETCAPTPTEHLFTGKERDTESGLDYFGARYYASNMGRWMSPDKPFADQHSANPQSWNLYEYGRNNPLRNIDLNGFKVLQAVVAQAAAKINSLSGGTLYLDFAGIQGLHGHPSLNAANNFDGWHPDHFAANSVIIPNNSVVSGFFRALFGLANKDQVDTGKAIVAAAKSSGQDVAFDTYSNGVNAAGQVAQGMSAGDLQSATVVGPNANSPAPVQAMDQADGDSTQIYISTQDPALALALFGSQSADDWTGEFGDRVHVTDQPSHNLNQYRGAQGTQAPNQGVCSAQYASCN
jgi:RHS repeat-associated protein